MLGAFWKKPIDAKRILEDMREIKAQISKMETAVSAMTEPTGPSNPRERLAVYLGDYTLLTTTDYGCKIYLDSRDISLAPHIALHGIWETWIANVFERHVRPGQVVVDIGCNVGYYSLLACKNVGENGTVIAIDANPRMTQLINRSLSVNGFSARSIVKNLFVGDVETEQVIRIPDQYMGSASRWISDETASRFGDTLTEKTVRQVPLTNILSSPRVDVIKIDAEGAEPIIWRGALPVLRNSSDVKVFMEWAPNNFNAGGFAPAKFLDEIRLEAFKVQEITTDSQCVDVTRERLLNCDWMEILLTRS